jgi:hypothetical protein
MTSSTQWALVVRLFGVVAVAVVVHIALEIGQDREHLEHRPPLGGGDVDSLLEDLHSHSSCA